MVALFLALEKIKQSGKERILDSAQLLAQKHSGKLRPKDGVPLNVELSLQA